MGAKKNKQQLKKAENESGQTDELVSERLASKSSTDDCAVDSPKDIQTPITGMEGRTIQSTTTQISANHAAIAKFDQTSQVIETSVNNFQGRLTALESTVRSFSIVHDQLQLKVDDLEIRSRRCNIRLIQEGSEGNKSPTVAHRAHRLPVRRLAPTACIHRFRVKQRILQLGRERGSLTFRGNER